MEWYTINNAEVADTPALIIYRSRVEKNIESAIAAIRHADLLRPHVKTSKIAEVCQMMMDKGISKFKCATIAEAEMLAMINAGDVLLAYQPVGPKANRLLDLVKHYPSTQFNCLVDNIHTARNLSELFSSAGMLLDVFIDLNTGMNRTGIGPAHVHEFVGELVSLPFISIKGIHAYDGHLREPDIRIRQQQSDAAFAHVTDLQNYILQKTGNQVTVVSGGSPTFSTHTHRNVECSPGTFVFWDYGYQQQFPTEPYEFAALVMTRIISIVNEHLFTTDLGYKAIAAENPLPRVHFLNAPGAVPVAQSEEHLSIQVPDASVYKTGDILYGVPVHICPSVAMYDSAWVVDDHQITGTWKVTARGRKINY